SMPRRGIWMRYPAGMGGSGVGAGGFAAGVAEALGATVAATARTGDAGAGRTLTKTPSAIKTRPQVTKTTRDMRILRAQRMPADRPSFVARRERASAALRTRGLAALLLAPGSDLAYLSGYRMFGSERLTCLVLTAEGDATLVVPALESPRARAAAPDLAQRTWAETDDPYALVASIVRGRGDVAVADQMWALFVLRLQRALPDRSFGLAS